MQRYLPLGESLVPEVEELVQTPKIAYPAKSRKRRSFRPEYATILAVDTLAGKHLQLYAYKTPVDYIVELWDGLRALRRMHTHDCHRNPTRQHVPGPHMHFPTINYPLAESCSSYAHRLDLVEFQSIEQAIIEFCRLTNVELQAMQPFLTGRRRP